MIRFRRYVELVRTSYWFIPTLMTMAAIGLALALPAVDDAWFDSDEKEFDWVYSGSADGARQLLATVAGSMITVAGVVFSITVVGLSLASSQFGPRLLRGFMRDRSNQVVLGTFIATYAYCLLVLRTIRGENGGHEFVPQLSITLGVLMAVMSVGVLIFFIHHSAISLQAPVVIAHVYRELIDHIDEHFPESPSSAGERNDGPAFSAASFPAAGAFPVTAERDGYIESLDIPQLHRIATEYDLQIRLTLRAGHFVTLGGSLAEVRVRNGSLQADPRDAIRNSIATGWQQTPLQDIEFIINQLVEVAVRALSPGINDPFTALTCIDYLGAALTRLSGRCPQAPARFDDDGTLRVLPNRLTYPDMVDTAFRQIRQYGHATPSVLIRLLETLTAVLRQATRPEDRAALIRQAHLISECAPNLQLADADVLKHRLAELQSRQTG